MTLRVVSCSLRGLKLHSIRIRSARQERLGRFRTMKSSVQAGIPSTARGAPRWVQPTASPGLLAYKSSPQHGRHFVICLEPKQCLLAMTVLKCRRPAFWYLPFFISQSRCHTTGSQLGDAMRQTGSWNVFCRLCRTRPGLRTRPPNITVPLS